MIARNKDWAIFYDFCKVITSFFFLKKETKNRFLSIIKKFKEKFAFNLWQAFYFIEMKILYYIYLATHMQLASATFTIGTTVTALAVYWLTYRPTELAGQTRVWQAKRKQLILEKKFTWNKMYIIIISYRTLKHNTSLHKANNNYFFK